MSGAGEQIRTADVLLGKRLFEKRSWQKKKHREITSNIDEILRMSIAIMAPIVICPG